MMYALRPSVMSALGQRTFSTARPCFNVAKLTLVGRLVAAPRTIESKNGRNICFYRVAVNSSRPNPEAEGERIQESFYHDIAAYGKAAEYIPSLSIGDLLYVEAEQRIVHDKDDSGVFHTKVYNTHLQSKTLQKFKAAEA